MKKVIGIIICICVILTVSSCSFEGENTLEDNEGNLTEAQEDSNVKLTRSPGRVKTELLKNLDINDFRFDVLDSQEDNEDGQYIYLYNNTKYDLLTVGVICNSNSYYEFHTEHIVNSQESVRMLMTKGVSLYVEGDYSELDYPRDNSKILYMNINNYSSFIEDKKYENVTLNRLSAVVLCDDNTLYNVYYDYSLKSWWVDSDAIEYSKWPSRYPASLVPEPKGHIYVTDSYSRAVRYDSNPFYFAVYDMEESEYRDYIESVMGCGFVVDNSYPPTVPDVENRTETIKAEDLLGNKFESVYAKDRKILGVAVTRWY